jgi:hypothetical protein
METHHENMAIWNAFPSNLGHSFHEKTFECIKLCFSNQNLAKLANKTNIVMKWYKVHFKKMNSIVLN